MAGPTAMMAAIAKASANIGKAIGTERLYNAMDRDKRLCGFKIPSLAYQILVCCDHLPFAVHGKSAPPHVGKSYLSIQEGVWAIQDGCMVKYTDSELKQSVDMIPSFLRKNLPKDMHELFQIIEAYSIEDWQKINTNLVKIAIENKYLPKAERFGIYSITDSLLGKGCEGSRDALMKEGFAPGRGYKEEVLCIKNYVEAFSNEGSFLAWVTIQHAKKSLDPNAKGVTAFNVAGGDAPRFAAMTHILMTRSEEWDEVDADGIPVAGHNIRMVTVKNGLGPDRRVIYAGLRWRNVEDGQGGAYQETWFDWNWSLGWFLAQQIVDNKHTVAKIRDDVLDAIKFKVLNKNNVECEKYGGKLTYSQFGAAIEADKAVRERLQNIFGVKKILHYKDMDLPVASVVKKGKGKGKGKKGEPTAEDAEESLADDAFTNTPTPIVTKPQGDDGLSDPEPITIDDQPGT